MNVETQIQGLNYAEKTTVRSITAATKPKLPLMQVKELLVLCILCTLAVGTIAAVSYSIFGDNSTVRLHEKDL